MSKIPRHLALELFDAWQNNARLGSMSDEFLHYLNGIGYFNYKRSVRITLARCNRFASDSFFDGAKKKGWLLLLKHGLTDKTAERKWDAPTKSQSSKELAKSRIEWLGAKEWRERNSRSAWNVCKR